MVTGLVPKRQYPTGPQYQLGFRALPVEQMPQHPLRMLSGLAHRCEVCGGIIDLGIPHWSPGRDRAVHLSCMEKGER